MVRIDHFRGFDEYYAIPYGEETAVNGAWEKGPGILLFDKINEVLGEQQIIAEDLGFLTDSVRDLLAATGYPGMKVLRLHLIRARKVITCRTITIRTAWFIQERMITRRHLTGGKNCQKRTAMWHFAI